MHTLDAEPAPAGPLCSDDTSLLKRGPSTGLSAGLRRNSARGSRGPGRVLPVRRVRGTAPARRAPRISALRGTSRTKLRVVQVGFYCTDGTDRFVCFQRSGERVAGGSRRGKAHGCSVWSVCVHVARTPGGTRAGRDGEGTDEPAGEGGSSVSVWFGVTRGCASADDT